jgi:hypothetical protein
MKYDDIDAFLKKKRRLKSPHPKTPWQVSNEEIEEIYEQEFDPFRKIREKLYALDPSLKPTDPVVKMQQIIVEAAIKKQIGNRELAIRKQRRKKWVKRTP